MHHQLAAVASGYARLGRALRAVVGIGVCALFAGRAIPAPALAFSGTPAAASQTRMETAHTLSQASQPQALQPGCNAVTSTYPAGTPVQTLVGGIAPAANVTAIWRFDNAAKVFRALYFPATATGARPPVDSSALGALDALFVCVSAPASLNLPGTAPSSGAGVVQVLVQIQITGGAAPAGGRPSTSTLPAMGVLVQALPAGNGQAAPVASATTDQSGAVSMSLAPGAYWLIVPRSPANAIGPQSGAALTRLPDGTVVVGWASVTLSAGGSASATITIAVQAP